MSSTRPLMLGSAAAITAIIIAASGAQAQAVYATPAAGDANITVPAGTAVMIPTQTGTPRTEGIVNPPGFKAQAEASTTPPPTDDGDTSYLPTPQAHTAANGVTYVSGGVGLQGKADIESMQKDYRLKLAFAASSGHYLADVNVTITDKTGATVLQITTEGPFLLVNLPAGTYTVSGTYQTATQTKKITVGKSGTRGYTLAFTQPVS